MVQRIVDESAKDIDELIQRKQSNLRPLILASIFVIVAAGTGLAVASHKRPISSSRPVSSIKQTDQATITTTPTKEAKKIDQLDGVEVNAALANRRPLAVMIENHPDARPQSGLGSASVVYEALAEGGITRFMAIFDHADVEKVGPVRSARMYYLDWALEYDAAYAHVGGNIAALDLIPQLKIKDLNEFSIGERAFHRIPQAGKALEHTMYTNLIKLRQIADQKFGSDQNWTKPTFKEPVSTDQRPTAETLTIDFSSPSYLVKWNYDPQTNSYVRSLAGSPHKDANTGEVIRASNIIVERVSRQAMTSRDGKDTFSMTTTGSGKADFFQDGQHTVGTWQKDGHSSPTKFMEGDKTFGRNPGPTWIEIVPPESTVTTN